MIKERRGQRGYPMPMMKPANTRTGCDTSIPSITDPASRLKFTVRRHKFNLFTNLPSNSAGFRTASALLSKRFIPGRGLGGWRCWVGGVEIIVRASDVEFDGAGSGFSVQVALFRVEG